MRETLAIEQKHKEKVEEKHRKRHKEKVEQNKATGCLGTGSDPDLFVAAEEVLCLGVRVRATSDDINPD